MDKQHKLGAIMLSLVSFSLPLILSGMLQQLYNWADAFIVGNVDGELALGAIGATSAPINFFVTAITGFTLGLSVLAARYFGEGARDDIPRILSVFSMLLFVIFAVISVLGCIFSPQLMRLLHTPEDSLALAGDYIRIIFLGFPFLAVYNVYAAILRGIGDSRTPFLAVLASSAANVALDILLVAYLGWGVRGAAVATVLSQLLMAAFTVLYSSRKYPEELRFVCGTGDTREKLLRGTKFGLPPMIQSCITSLGGLILQNFMNSFGIATVIAITTAYRIDTLIMLPIINLGSGIATFTSQSCGAGDTERAKRTLDAGLIISLAVSTALTVIVIPTGGRLIELFGAGAESVEIGSAFFVRIACFYPVFGLAMAFRGYLEGVGQLVYSSVGGIISLAVRIAASYIMAPYFGNMVIAYAEMVAWTLLLALYLIRALAVRSRSSAVPHPRGGDLSATERGSEDARVN